MVLFPMQKFSDQNPKTQSLLEYTLKISRCMAEIRTLDPLLNYVVEEVIELVGAERGYVVLMSSDNALDFRVNRSRDGSPVQGAGDQISKSILKEVIRTGQPLVLRDATHNPRFSQAESVVILRLRSVLCVPLISRGETIGAIYAENRSIRGRFSEDDVLPMILFANQAAVAIENAALNDDLEARVAARTKDLEQAKIQVEHSWAETVEANRIRTEWYSRITHDIRAPLSIVSMSLSYLAEGKMGPLTGEQLEWVGKSLNSILHVATLMEDLFTLSKIEIGGVTLHQEATDIHSFLQSVYGIAEGLPWPENVEIKLDIASPLPEICIDSIRIRQVLLNLFSNAQKFTTRGSVTLHARYLADRDRVVIGVADTGEGIAPEKRNLLFKRFQQIDDNQERREMGSGLGLAICRALVEMHDGSIWVESTPGVGSDFQFSLPLR